ncbi:PREDICTED: zinc finger BED domain-containing protein DAYSLEEPER-like, partial [Tarenaya hassleriana]|uniref:zinc finger BED domain-containing protein DAYSLEEPER-like n=1 Tax=Tarenaya hassleriana TaxID=28532 RepID=UPI00053C4EEE
MVDSTLVSTDASTKGVPNDYAGQNTLEQVQSFLAQLISQQKGQRPSSMESNLALPTPTIFKYFYFSSCFCNITRYVTGNEYMKEIFAVGWKIQQVMDCDDPFKRSMAERMKKKFDKYWLSDDINVIIFIATVLDPRFKLTYVNFMIKEIYNDEDKATSSSQVDSEVTSSGTSSELAKRTSDAYLLKMFRNYRDTGHTSKKNELEAYLEDVPENEENKDLDILYWWKNTGSKYPILSDMARDVLAIP